MCVCFVCIIKITQFILAQTKTKCTFLFVNNNNFILLLVVVVAVVVVVQFDHIVNFLRSPDTFEVPTNRKTLQILLEDAKYYRFV